MISGSTVVRVRYAETDQMGVAYHASYFAWFEVGRCELLRTAGYTYRDLEETGLFLPVTEATCRYVQPARYDDQIEVKARGRLVSPARIGFDYELLRGQTAVVLATGSTTHVATYPDGRPRRLPAHLKALFT